MKRFRLHKPDDAGYKVAVVILLLTASMMFFDPKSTGFFAYSAKGGLLEAALENSDVKAFAESNPDYAASILFLDAREVEYLGKKYPAIYSSLPSPLYEIRLEAGNEGMLVLMSDTEVYRAFVYAPGD